MGAQLSIRDLEVARWALAACQRDHFLIPIQRVSAMTFVETCLSSEASIPTVQFDRRRWDEKEGFILADGEVGDWICEFAVKDLGIPGKLAWVNGQWFYNPAYYAALMVG